MDIILNEILEHVCSCFLKLFFVLKNKDSKENMTKGFGWMGCMCVTRLFPHFRGLWVSLGIERFIHLTIVNASLDVEFMSVVLKFWSKSINYIMFPFGPISITLRDITILTSLPIQGADALCLLNVQDSSLLALKVSFTTQTLYSAIIRKWYDIIGIPYTIEHVEFLWVLLCICVFFPASGKPAMEYLPLAKTLDLGRPNALDTLLLTSIYQTMCKYVSGGPYHRVGGALWFIQMWLLTYFLELSNREPTSFKTLGLHAVHSLRTMPYDDLMSFFLGLVDQALVHLFLKSDFVHILALN